MNFSRDGLRSLGSVAQSSGVVTRSARRAATQNRSTTDGIRSLGPNFDAFVTPRSPERIRLLRGSATGNRTPNRQNLARPSGVREGDTVDNPIILNDIDDEITSEENQTAKAATADAAVVNSNTTNENEDPPFECSICFECPTDKGHISTINGCNHMFCYDCIVRSSQRVEQTSAQCPLCREPFHTISSLDGTKNSSVGTQRTHTQNASFDDRIARLQRDTEEMPRVFETNLLRARNVDAQRAHTQNASSEDSFFTELQGLLENIQRTNENLVRLNESIRENITGRDPPAH